MNKLLCLFIFSIFSLFLFITRPAPAYAVNTCIVSVSPTTGITGETKFVFDVNGDFAPSIDNVIIEIGDQTRTHPLSACTDVFGVCYRKVGPLEFGPFYNPGSYAVNVTAITNPKARGARPSLLCKSNTFTIDPNPITQSTTCTPPGIKSDGTCEDTRCKAVSPVRNKRECQLGTVTVPTSVPTSMPTPTKVPVPPPPCMKGLTDINNPASAISVNQYDSNALKTEKQKQMVKCLEVDTAVGPISTDPAAFIKSVFTILLSMAGGWAVVFIILGGYQLLFSQGDAEGTKEAREKITSAIIGIVFIILSLLVLQVIGFDIFHLPTFAP